MTRRAKLDPTCRCWRTGLTLQPGEHWTCGHVDNLDIYTRTGPHPHACYIDGQLCAPERSTINYAHNGSDKLRGQPRRRRTTTSRTW